VHVPLPLRWLLAVLMAACFLPRSAALDPNRSITQYIQNRWGAEQGFPGGTVNAFAATSDGYLWVGAAKGLVRFDGVSFRLFNHANTPSFPDSPVLGLAADAEGSLWVRLQTPDLVRFRGGIFQEVFPGEAPETGVTAMGQGTGGDILLARPRRLLRYSNGKLVQIASGIGFQARPLISIAETSDGTVWIGSRDEGLFSLHAGEISAPRGLPDRKINCLLPGTGPELWIGTDDGLVHWNGGEMSQRGLPPSLLHVEVLALTRDHDSNIWVGTANGLVRIGARGIFSTDLTVYRAATVRERLPGTVFKQPPGDPRPVRALFEDREGNLWVGRTRGIERYRDSLFLNYASGTEQRSPETGPVYTDAAGRTWYGLSNGGLFWLSASARGNITAAGLSKDVVYSITGGPGELWIGRQRGGLTELREQGDSFVSRTYTAQDGLALGSIYAVHRTRDGTVWAGTLNGGVSRLRNGRLTTYTTADGLLSNSISAIEEGADGTVWFATPNGLQWFAHERWGVYSSQDGIPPGRVNCLAEDSHGVLWVGTDAGLAFIRGGRLDTPHDPPEVLLEEVLGVADDGRGDLWIATSSHVVRAPRANLLAEVSGPGAVREFGPADGIPSTEGVRRQRSVVKDNLGRIWFSLHGGISVVDPARVTAGSAPAIVHIETVAADGRRLNTGAQLRIPSARQRITLGYIGLSLSVPDRVRYRYRLDGFDRDWSEPQATREAVYTNLKPGSYKFHVIASNSEGVWNGSEQTVAFEIVPQMWETWWFRSAMVIGCALGIVFLYRRRLRRLSARLNLGFEERLAERTRIAQELHDTLLQGFLSASMQVHVAADRLPEDSSVKPMLTRALDLMRQMIDEGRNAVQGLRSSHTPLDIEQAFSRIQQELPLQEQAGKHIDFRLIVEGVRRPLHPALRDEVYRIGREALINAFRHAKAKKIEMELKYSSNRLRILVRDDGCGIDPEILRAGRHGHWGLSGMRERADRIGARLHLMSSASAGTEIELSVPGNVAFQSRSKRTLTWWVGRKVRQNAPGEQADSKKAGQ